MTAPKIIYLQILSEWREESEEITWSEDQISKTDAEYIRSDLVDELIRSATNLPSQECISLKDKINQL